MYSCCNQIKSTPQKREILSLKIYKEKQSQVFSCPVIDHTFKWRFFFNIKRL